MLHIIPARPHGYPLQKYLTRPLRHVRGFARLNYNGLRRSELLS